MKMLKLFKMSLIDGKNEKRITCVIFLLFMGIGFQLLLIDIESNAVSDLRLIQPNSTVCLVGPLFGGFNNQLLVLSWVLHMVGKSDSTLVWLYDQKRGSSQLFDNFQYMFGAVPRLHLENILSIPVTTRCDTYCRWGTLFGNMMNDRNSSDKSAWSVILPSNYIRNIARDRWKKHGAFAVLKHNKSFLSNERKKISVHGRSFEDCSHCCIGTGHAPYTCKAQNLCNYGFDVLVSQFSEYIGNTSNDQIVLLSDGQNSDNIRSYPVVETNSALVVQMWMMVLSDIHIGHPESSVDYVVWRWRKQVNASGYMLPWDCYNL